ncbi:MAG: sulfatase [Promethearchaeota archaeon]
MKKPNIVFILIDDMGWMDLSCQGSTFYETPNIDSIARNGMRFTRAYASCPVCSPTRASIMTGKYPARVGITQWIGDASNTGRGRVIGANYIHNLPLKEKSLASTLQENGYRTYHVGKWHLGDEACWPEHHGFDVNVGGCHWGHPHQGYFSPWGIATLEDGVAGEYLTDRLTDEAIRLVERNDDRPFFLNMWYYSVHTPIQTPAENAAKYKKKVLEGGLDREEAFTESDEYFIQEGFIPRKMPRRVIQSDPEYAGMIERLDQNIGRLLNALKRSGKYENTIVMFYSDNGGLANGGGKPPTCNLPLRDGKSYMYEGGIREPLLVQWPGHVPAGTTCGVLVSSPDFYPTILDCCGIARDPGQHVDGRSFHGCLKDPGAASSRGAIYWHYPHYNGNGAYPASCIIEKGWKLIEWLHDGSIELFNLDLDIGEQEDLSGDQPARVKELLFKLKNWQDEVGAQMPRDNPRYPYFLSPDSTVLEGELVLMEGEGSCIKTRLSKDNPVLYEVSLHELLEPMLETSLKLKIGNTVRIGRLHVNDFKKITFTDAHAEIVLDMDSLVSPMEGERVFFLACKSINADVLRDEERARVKTLFTMPQVEISRCDGR